MVAYLICAMRRAVRALRQILRGQLVIIRYDDQAHVLAQSILSTAMGWWLVEAVATLDKNLEAPLSCMRLFPGGGLRPKGF